MRPTVTETLDATFVRTDRFIRRGPSIAVPGAPTGVSAVAGNAQATVSFTAPGSVGGGPITGYRVTSSPGGITATGASSPIVITGLTNGVAYTFTVAAQNAGGYGPESAASASVTPTAVTVPGAPTSVSASRLNDSTIRVTCVAPASNGGAGITQYRATASPGGATFTSATTTIDVTGLTAGNNYTFTVQAMNSAGYGSASAASNSITAPGLGPDMLANNSFNDTSVWTISGGSYISSGMLYASVVDNSASFVSQAPGLTNGLTYVADVVIASVDSAGNGLALKVGGSLGPGYTSTGFHRTTLTAGAGANFVIQGAGGAGFSGFIEEVHLYRLY